jgi:hypothetical protein
MAASSSSKRELLEPAAVSPLGGAERLLLPLLVRVLLHTHTQRPGTHCATLCGACLPLCLMGCSVIAERSLLVAAGGGAQTQQQQQQERTKPSMQQVDASPRESAGGVGRHALLGTPIKRSCSSHARTANTARRP